MFAQTFAKSVTFSGVGVHGGKASRITIVPVDKPQGISFHTADGKSLALHPRYLRKTSLGTCLKNRSMEVLVTEHLLAATAALGVYHYQVHFSKKQNHYELPILAGNSQDFYQTLKSAGVVSLKVPQPVLKLSKTVRVSQGQSMLLAMPAKKFELQVEVHYPKPIGSQKLIFKDMKKFGKDIAWARTFGWMADLKNNRAAGRSRGARFDNAIGVREDGTFTSAPKPLEFVRHKALDLLGDLAVLGMPLQTKIFASRPGHALNSMLVEKIYESF